MSFSLSISKTLWLTLLVAHIFGGSFPSFTLSADSTPPKSENARSSLPPALPAAGGDCVIPF